MQKSKYISEGWQKTSFDDYNLILAFSYSVYNHRIKICLKSTVNIQEWRHINLLLTLDSFSLDYIKAMLKWLWLNSVFFLSKSDWNAEILLLIMFCFNVILIITYATSFTFSRHTLLLWSFKSFKNVCYCYKHGTIIDTFLYIYF